MTYRGAAGIIVRVLWLFALASATAAPARADQPALDVLYVPTPDEVVKEMLRVTRTGKGDVVYDLGCGDGRIVIAAVRDCGAARGVGIDLDPDRIRESNANARSAGVADRTRFLEQDLFTSDFHEATVVALYLGEGLNRRLRPQLFEQLRPGARIASHTFSMSEWRADRVLDVSGDGQGHVVYHWVLPAGVAGTWRGSIRAPGGAHRCGLSLQQRFQKVTGALTWEGQALPIADGEVAGTRLSFTAEGERQGERVALSFSGQVRGEDMCGTVAVRGGRQAGPRKWSVRRDPTDLAGTWRWGDEALRVHRSGGRWSAVHLSGDRREPVPQLYVYGGGIHFTLEGDGRKRTFSGVVTGRAMVGTVEQDGKGASEWRAEHDRG